MKNQIIKNLTSSKNERKAFECIYDMTVGAGKGFVIVKNSDFERYGLKHRNRKEKAVKRLIEKGLVFRSEMDAWFWGDRYNAEGRIFGYSVSSVGCVRFLEDSEVMCE